ncbi:hypothetical protein SATMO3_60770 [Sporomusa aerivorans]
MDANIQERRKSRTMFDIVELRLSVVNLEEIGCFFCKRYRTIFDNVEQKRGYNNNKQ